MFPAALLTADSFPAIKITKNPFGLSRYDSHSGLRAMSDKIFFVVLSCLPQINSRGMNK
jgi:hypothetical protein